MVDRPKIRHLVIDSTDPERLAKFYEETMGLEVVFRAKHTGGISMTDGYMNLSIHVNRGIGQPSGLNHFGFLVEDNDEIIEKFDSKGYRSPSKRPADRHFAQYRAIDPDGNNFDLSTNGYDEIRPERQLSKTQLEKLAKIEELEKA